MDTRAAKAQWDKYLMKGEKLIAAMRADDTQAGQIMGVNPPSMQSKWQDNKFDGKSSQTLHITCYVRVSRDADLCR